jgi:hypothetical protein
VEADEKVAAATIGEPGSVIEAEGLIFSSGQQRPTLALRFHAVSYFSRQSQGEIFLAK